MKKLNNILLIDDDEITNFINTDIISGMCITEKITVCENGREAIEYLKKAYAQPPQEGCIPPDIIFLDLNMPVMNGFEFLKEYQQQFGETSCCKVIIMLTTSLRDEDIDYALKLKTTVTDYLEKPLSEEKVKNIIKQYFDFYFEKV
jgi:CheY-like chemotaxis protein